MTRFHKILLVALVLGGTLSALNFRATRATAAFPESAPAIEGAFTPDGHFPGEPRPHADRVRAWGSWAGADDNTGVLTFGPFPAPALLNVAVGGYPDRPGNAVYVERIDTQERIPILETGVGERWHVVDLSLPVDWIGEPLRLVAVDNTKGIAGWLAVSEPMRGREHGVNRLLERLSAWGVNGLLLGLLGLAALRWLPRIGAPQGCWTPLLAAACVAACGYLAFWMYFLHPMAGRMYSVFLFVVALATTWKLPDLGLLDREARAVGKLMLGIGCFYVALLHLFPSSLNLYDLAANRFVAGLPADNILPYNAANRLYEGVPLREPGADWLSSDRPPLQSGWQLLVWPFTRWLGFDVHTASGTAAIWLQLLWIPAAYGLFRTLRFSSQRAGGWIAAMALSGFFLLHSVFTWPKLSAAAFAIGAFGLWVLTPMDASRRRLLMVGAGLAALGWLSHGGVAFSYIALVPWIVWRMLRGETRSWLFAAGVFALFAVPWISYQKFYDPPGNRLLKWHLGGQIENDPRGTWQTIRDGYRELGWSGTWEMKKRNFETQILGDWGKMFDVSRETSQRRRDDEFFFSGRALTAWLLGLVLLPLVLLRRESRARIVSEGHTLAALAAWIAGSFVVWCLMMFTGYGAVIHQGSFAAMVALFVLCSAIIDAAGRWWLAVVVGLQSIVFISTWAISNRAIHGSPTGLIVVLLTGGAVAMFIVNALRAPRTEENRIQIGRGEHETLTDRRSKKRERVAFGPVGKSSQTMRRIPWIIITLGVLAFLVGPVQWERGRANPLAPFDGHVSAIGDSQFTPDGVFTSTDMAVVPNGIATRGSWLGSDAFQGRHETGWFAAQPAIALLVAGYPTLAGNQLELEVRLLGGELSRIRFTSEDPREVWQPWHVKLPSEAEALRVVAVDGSSAHGGWLGFSAPFVLESSALAWKQTWAVFQLITVTCLALALLHGPGLIWFQARASSSLHHLALAILVGPLLLAALGAACWALGGWIAPATLARLGAGGLLASIAWQLWRNGGTWRLPREVAAIAGAGALLSGFAMAKANYSGGPAGELFRGTISRTLAVGGHSDSRISFHVAQLVGNHSTPFGPEAESYYSPWSFGSRGPLAGLIAAPIMLATGAKPPRPPPDHRWQPFDPEGFATYRITLIALASLAGWAVFGAIAAVASPAWALLGGVIALLAPFFVHELYFTWPKLITAGVVLAAFVLAHRRNTFASGVVLGVGYLFHPLAALSAPFLALWLFARADDKRGWRRFLPPAFCTLGVLVLVLPWQIVGRWHPGDGDGAQAIFFHYFRLADNAGATWPTWWQSRWDNFANTFIPGYLLAGDPTHESVNSVHEPSDSWVRTSFLYWNTLPFALGVPGFLLVAGGIISACRRAPAVAFATFVGPCLLMIAYWGAASTGLMRHCGHMLFVSAIVLATWSLARWDTAWRRRAIAMFLHPAWLAWRAFEIALIAFGTTFLNQPPALVSPFGWNDLLSLVLAASCLGAAVILLANAVRSIRSNLLPATTALHP